MHVTFWEALLYDVTDNGNIFLNTFSDYFILGRLPS